MPELPEVEAVARSLRPLVAGRTIVRCQVLHAIAVQPQSLARFAEKVEGQRIESVERRGKYLLLRLTWDWMVLHFRFAGQLTWFDSAKEFSRAARKTPPAVHIDVAYELDRGVLGFADPRHLGRVQWFEKPEDCAGVRSLGVEPLAKEFTASCLEELLRQSNRPVKLFLLDQARIAGMGNIYSSEALWHARLNPRRRAKRLQKDEVRRLHKAVVNVLRRALECCLDPAPDFRDANWWFQGLEAILRVYGREGKPCRRCGAEIARIEQGGRSTYFCRSCQR